MNNKIKTIIFDLGGVLVDWQPSYLYRKIFKSQESIDYFLKHICNLDWNELHDGGQSVEVGTRDLIAKFPEYATEIEAYYSRWDEMVGGVIKKTESLLEALKESKKYQLLALTNWPAEKWPYALEHFEFLNHFEGILVSGFEKLKKPDPAIYNLTLSRFNATAEESLFIDDNKRNILAANDLGIQTIHFTSPENLEEELVARKLL